MKTKTKTIVLLSLFIALELVLMLTPLGFVPVGPLRITTLHIPVIIVALVLGLKEGMFLGFVFGLTSLIINTITPTITSFVFSPFVGVGQNHGNLASLLIVLGPRILLGAIAYYTYQFLLKFEINEKISIVLASIVATFSHSVLVLGGIYLFFQNSYASVRGLNPNHLFNVLMGVIATNGILEMILAAIICFLVVQVLKRTINFN